MSVTAEDLEVGPVPEGVDGLMAPLVAENINLDAWRAEREQRALTPGPQFGRMAADIPPAMDASLVHNVVDAIVSPETTGQPIPPEVMTASAVLGYSGGNSWLTFKPYEKARPALAARHWVIPVTLSCALFGHMYDIEDHGGSNANIGVFMHNAIHVWRTPEIWGPPWLYTFASNGEAMLAAARSFGYVQGRDFYYLSSHDTMHEHVCEPDVCGFPKADGTQFAFFTAYDRSVLRRYMLPTARKAVDPLAIFPTDVHDRSMPNAGNERLLVEQLDGALEHPAKYRDYLKGELYNKAKQFRDRIWRVSHYEPPEFSKPRPSPDWSNDRGQRWQGLNNRMKKITALP